MPDWSRVQAVPPKTKTDVHLYKDEAPQGSQKIQGRFDSATTGSLTLRLKDGQTRTMEKSAVRKVLTRRPFAKRKPGWIALGVTLGILSLKWTDHKPISTPQAHAVFTLPIAGAFFYGSRMGGGDLRSPAQASYATGKRTAVRCPGQSSRKATRAAPGLSNPQPRWRRSPVLAQNRPWRFPFGPNTL